MYESIKALFLSYIMENRPDLQAEIDSAEDSKLHIEKLMSGTQPNIKFLLSQGINRNKIQWICFNELIDSIADPEILIVKSSQEKACYRRLRTGTGLSTEMLDLMSFSACAVAHHDLSLIAMN